MYHHHEGIPFVNSFLQVGFLVVLHTVFFSVDDFIGVSGFFLPLLNTMKNVKISK